MPLYIKEQAILQEAEVIKADARKAIFRMVMQTADEVNQNKRRYPKSVLNEGMEKCDERIKKRAMLGEMDHPVVSGNTTYDGVRQTTVMLKETSHLIRDYEWDGNKLMGELETTETPNGKILFNLLREKCGIGLSMRGMAELEVERDIKVVKSPLYIITFDAVANPSHKAAVVDFNSMKFESLNVLTESCNGGVICTPDGKCYLPDYFQSLVDKRIVKFSKRWV